MHVLLECAGPRKQPHTIQNVQDPIHYLLNIYRQENVTDSQGGRWSTHANSEMTQMRESAETSQHLLYKAPFSPTLQSVVQRAATQRNDLRAKRKKIVLSLLLCAITETFTAYIRDLRQNTMKKGKASFSPVPYS